MTNPDIARGWLRQAKNIFEEARQNFQKQLWHLVVRRCQESVEMSLKALLAWIGLEIPRIHDVGFLLKKNKDRFPETIRDKVDQIQSISRHLKKERETSFYGDEELMLPPDVLYNSEDAKTALTEAEFIYQLAKVEIGEDEGVDGMG
ncbi:MAG TPA: DNA-binding protein, partial [Deltaproteobacteria bacterium]|nr:DNA-binding protein [Deltaproteobacteria bacterium]